MVTFSSWEKRRLLAVQQVVQWVGQWVSGVQSVVQFDYCVFG